MPENACEVCDELPAVIEVGVPAADPVGGSKRMYWFCSLECIKKWCKDFLDLGKKGRRFEGVSIPEWVR